MSKWTEFRDALLDNMRGSTLNITEQTKQDFMEQFMEAGMPVVEQYAEKFVETVKKQAEFETGWVKIRDSVVIPFGVNVILFVVRQMLEKTRKATMTK
nr:MAG TPA: hypothetical protein [Caudoviricetes sp.]